MRSSIVDQASQIVILNAAGAAGAVDNTADNAVDNIADNSAAIRFLQEDLVA